MAHDHVLVDDDNRFIIDGATRQITNITGNKPTVMQFDHNAEILTFQMDRFVDGHDMLNCDRIEIHYTNTGKGTSASTRPVAASIDTVKDLAVSKEDEKLLTFTWTIRSEATQYAGTLVFQFKFVCNGETVTSMPTFVWHTGQYSFVEVLPSLNITDEIVEAYPDVLASLSTKVDKFGNTISEYEDTIKNLEDSKLDSDEADRTYTTKKEFEDFKNGTSAMDEVNSEIDSLKTNKLDKTALASFFIIGTTEPSVGPALWFDTSGRETTVSEDYILMLELGGVDDEASVTTTIDGDDYSVTNLSEPEASETCNAYYFTHTS